MVSGKEWGRAHWESELNMLESRGTCEERNVQESSWKYRT